ncbi:MFS general substrate transporter [Obba rivulosa]|uniref:MFS general substrate transporter n=1 Tax=Obba rivulosa TaxID=1052685 RepID=A0A8E2ATW2_9APHY|nr:MFS general substrate transporter [Obba rivulosa]
MANSEKVPIPEEPSKNNEALLRRIVRKIDYRLNPLMLACYTLQFVDKVLLNYANIMGLSKDVGMNGSQFSWLATAFFIVFSVAQLPGGYFLARYPVNVYLGCNMVLCGISLACTSACTNYASLVACRVFLAIGESSIAPSLSLVTMKWYTREESSKRYGFWYTGLGWGQIIGGLLSFGFQHVPHGAFGSWRGMFLTLGLVNLLVAAWSFVIPDNPASATFLDAEEREWCTRRLLLANKTAPNARRFNWRQAFRSLQDVAVWLIFLISALCSLLSGAITTFSSTLITGFGYSPEHAALLNIPSGAVTIISTLLATYFDRQVPRSLAILILVAPSITGGALMSFAHGKAASLVGIWLINTVTPILIIAMSWAQANCAGHTKRVVYNAMVMIAFGVGNICGPQTFRAKQAPTYRSATITILVATALAGVVTVILLFIYIFRNRRMSRRDTLEDVDAEVHTIANQTDLDMPTFTYVY